MLWVPCLESTGNYYKQLKTWLEWEELTGSIITAWSALVFIWCNALIFSFCRGHIHDVTLLHCYNKDLNYCLARVTHKSTQNTTWNTAILPFPDIWRGKREWLHLLRSVECYGRMQESAEYMLHKFAFSLEDVYRYSKVFQKLSTKSEEKSASSSHITELALTFSLGLAASFSSDSNFRYFILFLFSSSFFQVLLTLADGSVAFPHPKSGWLPYLRYWEL